MRSGRFYLMHRGNRILAGLLYVAAVAAPFVAVLVFLLQQE